MYLFEYHEDNKDLGKIYTSYDDLNGVVLCDHSILRKGPLEDVITKMVGQYNYWRDVNFEYSFEYGVRGLVIRTIGDRRYEDRVILEVFDEWKNVEYEQALAPYIRTNVEDIILRFLNELEKEKKKPYRTESILDKRLDIHEKFQLVDITEKFYRETELKDEEIKEINDIEEMGVEGCETEQEDEVLKQLWECNHDILTLYGLRKNHMTFLKSVGCYSKVFFSTIVDMRLVEDLGVCNGCLLSDKYAKKLDSQHTMLHTGFCGLSVLLEANLMLLLFSNKDAHSKIREELLLPDINDIMMKKILRLVDYRNREYYVKVFRKLMDGGLTKQEIFPWNKEAEVKIQQYLEYGNISPENLVYKPTVGSNGIDKAALVKMMRECKFRFSETNGCYIKGHCYRCWGRLSHKKRDPKCHRGRIAEILIHSYYERLLLQMYFLERGLTFRLPTVCHVVDLMVYCSRESAPLFIDYVLWLLSRYERMVIA